MVDHCLIVSDANVLIDMDDGGLTYSLFSLPCTVFCTPDVLYDQELREKHPHLPELGLKLFELLGETVAKVYSLAQTHPRVSRLDLFALQLAREQKSVLLTGDMPLRKIAEKYQVACHGTIWVVEQMLQAGILQVDIAEHSYNQMRLAGSRLPWDRAYKGLEKFRVENVLV